MAKTPRKPTEETPYGQALLPTGDDSKAYIFDAIKRAAYLERLANGGRRLRSAIDIGINPSTISRTMASDPVFAESVSKAEMMADEVIENALFEAAKAGNTTAEIFWLTNRKPDEWKDRRGPRVVVTGGRVDEPEGVPQSLGEALGLEGGDELSMAVLLHRALPKVGEVVEKMPVIDVEARLNGSNGSSNGHGS